MFVGDRRLCDASEASESSSTLTRLLSGLCSNHSLPRVLCYPCLCIKTHWSCFSLILDPSYLLSSEHSMHEGLSFLGLADPSFRLVLWLLSLGKYRAKLSLVRCKTIDSGSLTSLPHDLRDTYTSWSTLTVRLSSINVAEAPSHLLATGHGSGSWVDPWKLLPFHLPISVIPCVSVQRSK